MFGGGGGQPPPHNVFSEFCRYISKFVATCKPTSMSFVPTKYLKYQQNIERTGCGLGWVVWMCVVYVVGVWGGGGVGVVFACGVYVCGVYLFLKIMFFILLIN